MTDLVFKCHLEDVIWLLFTALKRLNLEVATKRAYQSTNKNAVVVLVPCLVWKIFPTTIFDGIDIPEVLGCHFL